MFTIKRNQVIITALVIMIAIAGYLNYIDTTAPDEGIMTSGDMSDINPMILDEATGQEVMVVNDNTIESAANPVEGEIGIALTYDELMNGGGVSPLTLNDVSTEPEAAAEVPVEEESGGAVFVNNTSDSSFFVQAKLDREQSRAKQKETLTELINNQNVDKEQKAECANSMLDIQQRIEKETAAEALIEAKGFSEAYVRIDNDTVDVVVSKSVLSDAEIAQIEDIVKRKTGIESSNIRVAPLKAN